MVLDGMPYLMRYGYESDLEERTKMLQLIAHRLRLLAYSEQVAVIMSGHASSPSPIIALSQVVVTNQMTFCVDEDRSKPALGRNWSSVCSSKICLRRSQDADGRFLRTASLVKSPLAAHQSGIPFQITVTANRLTSQLLFTLALGSPGPGHLLSIMATARSRVAARHQKVFEKSKHLLPEGQVGEAQDVLPRKSPHVLQLRLRHPDDVCHALSVVTGRISQETG